VGLIKGVTRFNYWQYVYRDPSARRAITLPHRDAIRGHAVSSDRWRVRFRNDPRAIYEFAKADICCLRSHWVVDQIERWRIENTIASRKKVKAFFRAYGRETPGRGARMGKQLFDEIEDDIRTFEAIYTHAKRQAIFDVHNETHRVFTAGWPPGVRRKSTFHLRLIFKAYVKAARRHFFKIELDEGPGVLSAKLTRSSGAPISRNVDEILDSPVSSLEHYERPMLARWKVFERKFFLSPSNLTPVTRFCSYSRGAVAALRAAHDQPLPWREWTESLEDFGLSDL